MIFSIFDVEKISSQLAFTQSNLYYLSQPNNRCLSYTTMFQLTTVA